MKRVNPDEISGEEEYELKAAFGEEAVDNGEIIELEPEKDLVPSTASLPRSFADVDEVETDRTVEVGDVVTVRFTTGMEFTGECTSTRDYGFTIEGEDPRGEYDTIPKILSYEDFEGEDEPGLFVELLSIEEGA